MTQAREWACHIANVLHDTCGARWTAAQADVLGALEDIVLAVQATEQAACVGIATKVLYDVEKWTTIGAAAVKFVRDGIVARGRAEKVNQ